MDAQDLVDSDAVMTLNEKNHVIFAEVEANSTANAKENDASSNKSFKHEGRLLVEFNEL